MSHFSPETAPRIAVRQHVRLRVAQHRQRTPPRPAPSAATIRVPSLSRRRQIHQPLTVAPAPYLAIFRRIPSAGIPTTLFPPELREAFPPPGRHRRVSKDPRLSFLFLPAARNPRHHHLGANRANPFAISKRSSRAEPAHRNHQAAGPRICSMLTTLYLIFVLSSRPHAPRFALVAALGKARRRV